MKPKALLLVLLISAASFARTLADMEPVLAKIAAYEHGQSREPVAAFEQFMREALGARAQLDAIEQRLLKLLGSDATLAGKDIACRHLSIVGTAASVPVLAPMLARPETAEMARFALERIPSPEVDRALRAALPKAQGKTKIGIVNSVGARADRQAVPLLKPLLASTDAALAEAAAAALGRINGPAPEPVISADALTSSDPKAQAAAIRQADGRALAAAFSKVSPLVQVRILTQMGERNTPGGLPVATGAANASEPEVRVAALTALGTLGSEASVPLLAEAAAAREGAEQTAARESLYRLRGASIDPAIAAAIGPATGKVKLELIRAAGERGISSAAGPLLAAARDADHDVRRESLRALRDTAGSAQTPELLALVTGAANAADRREAGRTLAAVLKQSGKPSIDGVLAAYRSAPSAALVEVLGQVASDDALPTLRSALRDPNREISRAAILALTDWPTPAPIPDLLGVARDGSILALRGYIKLAAIPNVRPHPETARLLAGALALAKQPDEKKAVLAALQTCPSKEALELAEAARNDTAVAQEAQAAADRIRQALEAHK